MEELKVVARWHSALHYTWHTWRGEKRAGGNNSGCTHSVHCKLPPQHHISYNFWLCRVVVPGSWHQLPPASVHFPVVQGRDRREESIIRPTIISFVIHKAFL